jgi:hypothetical protein
VMTSPVIGLRHIFASTVSIPGLSGCASDPETGVGENESGTNVSGSESG